MRTYKIEPDQKSADVQAALDKKHGGAGRARIVNIDWASGTAHYEIDAAPAVAEQT